MVWSGHTCSSVSVAHTVAMAGMAVGAFPDCGKSRIMACFRRCCWAAWCINRSSLASPNFAQWPTTSKRCDALFHVYAEVCPHSARHTKKNSYACIHCTGGNIPRYVFELFCRPKTGELFDNYEIASWSSFFLSLFSTPPPPNEKSKFPGTGAGLSETKQRETLQVRFCCIVFVLF